MLTSGLTLLMVEAKLPLAVGSRSPILRVALTPSTERSCGACRTLVLVSLSAACSSAPGSVVAKSALLRWPRLLRGIRVPVVPLAVVEPVVPVVLVLPVVLGVVLVVDVVEVCTWMLCRGLNTMGRFKPVEAMAALSWRVNDELGFHDQDVHHHLRAWLVEVMDHLGGQRHFVGFPAHDDGILRGERHHPLQLRDGADGVDDFLDFLRRADVGQVERLRHHLLEIAALVGIIVGDENGVGGERLPIGLGDDADVVQRLVQGGVFEIQIEAVLGGRLIVRVPEDVDARHLTESFVQDLDRLAVDFQVADGLRIERLQLGNRQHAVDLVLRQPLRLLGGGQTAVLERGRMAGLLHPLALALDHLLGDQQLLLGHRRARIDRVGLLEFDQGFADLPGGADLDGAFDVLLRVLEPGLVHGHLVNHLGRILGQRLLVGHQRRIPFVLGLVDSAFGQVFVTQLGLGLERQRGAG